MPKSTTRSILVFWLANSILLLNVCCLQANAIEDEISFEKDQTNTTEDHEKLKKEAQEYEMKLAKAPAPDQTIVARLSMIYFKLGDFPSARSYIESALKLEKKNAGYWEQLFNCLSKLGQSELSIVALKRAIANCSNKPEQLLRLKKKLANLQSKEASILDREFPNSSKKNRIEGRFKYYFHESTGQNLYVEVAKKQWPIRFDKAKSDSKELSALRSLGWPILYPNAKGAITLVGEIDKERQPLPFGSGYADPPGSYFHKFTLKHWFLKTPFNRGIVGGDIPSIASVEKSTTLKPSDFTTKIALPPHHFLSP